jgi:TonB family protein
VKNISLTSFFVMCLCVYSLAQDSQKKSKEGSGIGTGKGKTEISNSIASNSKPVRILSKPRANYTEMARQNGTEGIVTLKVTFLASGQIGGITPISALPDGLTEQAIAAARNIKFEPAERGGQAFSVTKTIEYLFVIFIFNEAQEEQIGEKAEILEKPKPDYPEGEDFKKMRGSVKLNVILTSFGQIRAEIISSDLPKEFQYKAVEAAQKIKYQPATTKNKIKISVSREIVYEFVPEN